jgi:hypothetical protein
MIKYHPEEQVIKQVINTFINKNYYFFKNTFIFDLPE